MNDLDLDLDLDALEALPGTSTGASPSWKRTS